MLPLPIECNTAVLRPWLYWWWHKHVNPVNNKKIMVTFVKTWTRPFCSSCLVHKTRSHCLPNKGFEIFPRHSVWEVIVINAYLSHQSWKAPGDLGWGFLAQGFVRCCQLCGYLFNIWSHADVSWSLGTDLIPILVCRCNVVFTLKLFVRNCSRGRGEYF